MKRRPALRCLGGLAVLLASATFPRPVPAAVRAPVSWQAFGAASEAALRQQLRGRPFVLVFWSIHCPPCRDELELWADGQRRFPGLRLVLVNTDQDDELAAAGQLLENAGASRLDHRVMNDEMVERVRWSVDPAWRGELPMARFYDAAHTASTRLGKLDAATLDGLLRRLSGGAQ